MRKKMWREPEGLVKRWVARSYSDGAWILLSADIYAETEDEAWKIAVEKHKRPPVTIVQTWRSYIDSAD